MPIPENDLWVLAGSCGVDVGELVPEHGALALEAGPDSIGDTIAFLRRNQDNGGGRAALALEAANAGTPVYSGPQTTAPPPVEQFAPDPFASDPFAPDPFAPDPFAPEPFVPASFAIATEPTTAAPVDVFEELARLPEPVPLTSEPDDYPDMLAPPALLTAEASVDQASMESSPIEPSMADTSFAPPAGTYELVDDEPFTIPSAASTNDVVTPDFVGFDSPTVVEAAPDTIDRPWTPEDAPPIDVALRGETFADPTWTTDWQTDAPTWPTPDWEHATSGVWNEPDAGSGPPAWSTDDADHVPGVWGTADAFGIDPDADEVGTDLVGADDANDETADPPVGLITLTSYEALRDLPPLQPAPQIEHTQWTHEPDPEATSTGFLVDWGDPDAPVTPRPEWATRGAIADRISDQDESDESHESVDVVDTIEHVEAVEFDATELLDPVATADEPPAWDAPIWEPEAPEPTPDEISTPDDGDALAPISWRPEEATVAPAAAAVVTPIVETAAPAPMIDDPAPDAWTTAGEDWELGNALPLVEVRGQGALVMRRADERWALADLTVADRYLVEVELEFRAGPGFGVLFRADVDGDGRMSAYSFDVDPVYEGGGFLVRQWQADRELWNPIAHVSAEDPGSMYGSLTVRLEVLGERLVASVNNDVVMTVDDLEQGSIERGRSAPTGNRVGVQAWSSSDLVIETLRIADR